MNENLPVVVTQEGRGHAGYCKICASNYVDEINRRLKKKDSIESIRRWLKELGFLPARQTLYAHRDHITDPKTTFVQEARKYPIIKGTTTKQFLEAIKDVAHTKAAMFPDIVTIDHGLAAAKILMQDKRGADGITLVLMKVFTDKAEEVIEGDYREVTDSG